MPTASVDATRGVRQDGTIQSQIKHTVKSTWKVSMCFTYESCTRNNNVRGNKMFLWHDFELKESLEKGITLIVY